MNLPKAITVDLLWLKGVKIRFKTFFQPKPVRIKILHEDGEDLHEDMDISEDAEPSVDDPLRPRTQEEMEESSRVDTYRDKHNKGFVDIKNPAEFKVRFLSAH